MEGVDRVWLIRPSAAKCPNRHFTGSALVPPFLVVPVSQDASSADFWFNAFVATTFAFALSLVLLVVAIWRLLSRGNKMRSRKLKGHRRLQDEFEEGILLTPEPPLEMAGLPSLTSHKVAISSE
jgi:hypothetical protein